MHLLVRVHTPTLSAGAEFLLVLINPNQVCIFSLKGHGGNDILARARCPDRRAWKWPGDVAHWMWLHPEGWNDSLSFMHMRPFCRLLTWKPSGCKVTLAIWYGTERKDGNLCFVLEVSSLEQLRRGNWNVNDSAHVSERYYILTPRTTENLF